MKNTPCTIVAPKKKSLSCTLHSTLFILPLRTDDYRSCSSSSLQTHKIKVPCVCIVYCVYWMPEACIQIVAQQNKHTHKTSSISYKLPYTIQHMWSCWFATTNSIQIFKGVFRPGWTRFLLTTFTEKLRECKWGWNLSCSVCLLILFFLYLEHYGII